MRYAMPRKEVDKLLDELIRQATALEWAMDKLVRNQQKRRTKLTANLAAIWL